MFGVLNINKPLGMTSRAVVDRVQRVVRPAKVGHAGTLDPLATGVLLICVGPATRLVDYAHQLPKKYRATFLLGQQSPTDDLEGEVEHLADAPSPSLADIEEASAEFVGQIEQRPPIFSAVKISGKPAYRMARRGQEIDIPTRQVTIHALEIVRYDYPEVVLDIQCGSGTYIRSLGRDLAESLGTAAVMSALVRTAVGGFAIENATELDALPASADALELESPLRLLRNMSRVTLTPEQQESVRNGRTTEFADTNAVEIAAIDVDGKLFAILVRLGDGTYRAKLNLRVS